MRVREGRHERQPDPASLFFLGGEEGVEDSIANLGRDPRSRIFDCEEDFAALRDPIRGNPDRAVRGAAWPHGEKEEKRASRNKAVGTRRDFTIPLLSEAPIRLGAVQHASDRHELFCVIHLVEHAPVAYAKPPGVLSAFELLAPRRPGIGGERKDTLLDPIEEIPRKPVQVSPRVLGDVNAVAQERAYRPRFRRYSSKGMLRPGSAKAFSITSTSRRSSSSTRAFKSASGTTAAKGFLPCRRRTRSPRRTRSHVFASILGAAAFWEVFLVAVFLAKSDRFIVPSSLPQRMRARQGAHRAIENVTV